MDEVIHMKKGQGLSMNTIVIAAIVLLVLVVLSVVFLREMDIFSRGSKDCEALGGTCLESCGEGYVTLSRGVCLDAEGEDTGLVCCDEMG